MGTDPASAPAQRHVTVLIDGKQFRMACDDGQEAHLRQLAVYLDDKIRQMRQAFGEIGDQRLTMMAALMVCDEFFEARSNAGLLADQAGAVDALEAANNDLAARREVEIAAVIDQVSDRIERITGLLSGQPEE